MNPTLTASISLAALRHNLEVARARAGSARVLAVVKADAYGHGLLPVALALAETADGLGVARLEEALTLREAGIKTRIVLLSSPLSKTVLGACCEHTLDLCLYSMEGVEMLMQTPLQKPLGIWLKLDTGMHRLGLFAEEFQRAGQLLKGTAAGKIIHMSHFACADDPDSPVTAEQEARFKAIAKGHHWSLANSAALLSRPESCGDWVRPGLMLYGASPFADGRPLPELRPAMRLEATLLSVRELAAGERVGYGGKWQATSPTRIGTAAIGYADGYPWGDRPLPVLVRGERAETAGQVSMDMIGLNLSSCPHAVPGDPVLLWGEGLPIEEVAAAAGVIPYTLFTGLGNRVEKHHF